MRLLQICGIMRFFLEAWHLPQLHLPMPCLVILKKKKVAGRITPCDLLFSEFLRSGLQA
jgi:hypothetical protein